MPSRVAFWRLSTSLESMTIGMDGALRMYQAVATLIARSLRSFGLSLTSAFMYVSLQNRSLKCFSLCPFRVNHPSRALNIMRGNKHFQEVHVVVPAW